MTQSILTIDREKFRQQIRFISTGTLKMLLEGLFKQIKDTFEKYPVDVTIDLERKQTIIWQELWRRKYLTKENFKEFEKWLYRNHNKKYY